MPEIVYLLQNPVFPDLVKIGRTINLEERMRSLSSHAGVPVPFECLYACEVQDGVEVEKRLHMGFGDHRESPKREFFRINPERVKAILELVSLKDVTPTSDVVEDEDDIEALKRARSRRPVFRFTMVDISPGELLQFVRDESITCTVKGDREVEYDGRTMSLNQVTQEVFLALHGKERGPVRGPDFWLYEKETLTERRLRMEQGEQ